MPIIDNRRKSQWPIFEVWPNRSFPPDECCLGDNPIQAEKSRHRLKVVGSGAKVNIAAAVIGPTPGMVIRRAAVLPFREAALIAFSRRSIRDCKSEIWSRIIFASRITASGKTFASSDRAACNRFRCTAPNGAITLCSTASPIIATSLTPAMKAGVSNTVTEQTSRDTKRCDH